MRRWQRLLVLFSFSPVVATPAQVSDGFTVALTAAVGLSAVHTLRYPRESYAGRDDAGVPHYLRRPFSADERRLLRRWFGIEDPSRLYLSDSTASSYLVYDTERDPGAERLVRSYRIGAPSIREPGESWEELERRVRRLDPRSFPRTVRRRQTSLDSLDPLVRPHFVRMITEARTAGHRVRVVESRRSPERQAYLMARGGGLTFTATSMHASGHAVDLVVGDGNLKRRATRARWIAFRRWLASYEDGRFRMIGTPARSWDWPHVELAEGMPGFGSIEALLEAARNAEAACCEGFTVPVHSTDDLARSGAATLSGTGSRHDTLRVDGTAGGAPLSP